MPRAPLQLPALREALSQYVNLLVLLRSYWGSLLRSALLGLLIAMVSMAPPYLSKLLIDEVYPARDRVLMEVLIAGLLALAVTVAAMDGIRSYFQTHVSARLTSAATLHFFNHLQHLRPRFFEQRQVGEVMSRFGDVRVALASVARGMGTVFVQGMYLVLVPVFLFVLEWRLALVVVGFGVLTVVVTLLSARVLRNYYVRTAEAQADLRGFQVEALSHTRTLKVLSVEHLVFDRARTQSDVALEHELHAGAVGEGFNFLTTLVAAIGAAALTWYAWTLILRHEMTLGEYVAFMAYVAFFSQPLSRISRMFQVMQQAGVSLARMFEYLEETPEQDPVAAYREPPPVRHRLRGRVELRGVAFGYTAQEPVLHDIDLVLEPEALTAVVGQSGTGKSSLLRLICRFEEPVQGTILYDGISGGEIPLRDVRSQISVVWQDASLFKGTIWENLTLGASSPARSAVDDVVGVCRLDEMLTRLPKGYDTSVAEWGASLSAGQRQRVALARALIRDTPILLMDEATSNIDQQTESAILSDLFARRANLTTLFVTHRVGTVSSADKVCVMRQGRIVGLGSHESLLESCGTYIDMVNAGAANPGRLQLVGARP
ncbi:MAG: cyaB [Gemmatimonadetes bacterium]|nr:cyaB [Gemmatimonadota bacterium]